MTSRPEPVLHAVGALLPAILALLTACPPPGLPAGLDAGPTPVDDGGEGSDGGSAADAGNGTDGGSASDGGCAEECALGCPCPQDPCIDAVPLRFGQIPVDVRGPGGDSSKYLGARNPAVIPWPHYTSNAQNSYGLGEHVQGIQRLGRHLLLTGSGKLFAPPTGHLIVVEMGSRPETGPWSLPSYGHDWQNPPAEDRVVSLVALDALAWHAGGIQVVGNILAVPLYADDTRGEVRFYRMEDPKTPRELLSARLQRSSTNVKSAGMTRLAGGRYLVLAWDDATLDFFLSNSPRLEDGFSSSFHSLSPSAVTGGFQGGGCGLSGCGTYQNLNFVRQCDGTLYLVGTRNQEKGAPALPGDDLASLYRVDFPGGIESAPSVTFESRRQFTCADQQCSFGAGAGTFVQDSTRLALYGASHWLHDGNNRYNFNEYAPP